MSQTINFYLRPEIPKEGISLIPPPIPAIEAIGGWFTRLNLYSNSTAALEQPHVLRHTLKACSPFLDAMATGYVLRSFCDIGLEVGPQYGIDEGRFRLTADFDGFKPISYHEPWQLDGHPLGQDWGCKLAGKFQNPWIIKTPQGVSCLFAHPLQNDPEQRFYSLSGVVATDVYPMPVEMPFLVNCKAFAGKNLIIRRETPLCLVIPFRREDWIMKVGTLDTDCGREARQGVRILTSHLRGAYNKYWRKKARYR